MTIYKEDIEECQHRVEAWWSHEIIDSVVVQRLLKQVTCPETLG